MKIKFTYLCLVHDFFINFKVSLKIKIWQKLNLTLKFFLKVKNLVNYCQSFCIFKYFTVHSNR